MTAVAPSAPRLASHLVNGLLAIKPLANLAKRQARQMMIKRAESIGVHWTKEVEALKAHDWDADLAQAENSSLKCPEYYKTSFHAYEEGNLGWEPALEVEVAAYAVHARIWQDTGAKGDARLRQSYQDVLEATLPHAPKTIVDLGCGVGMSTFAMQTAYPNAAITGVDLSPYFLAVANYRSRDRVRGTGYGGQGTEENSKSSQSSISNLQSVILTPHWLHAPAEATGLPAAYVDLVSACLVFHELPKQAALAVFQEAHRILHPGGYFALMDMNPLSEVFAKMPPYILTLLKSTEPYLDEYFALNLEEALVDAGFERPTIVCNSPRHRTIVAKSR